MKRRKYQHIVESIVNSEQKQQGNFKETAELVTDLLLKHLNITGVSVWLFNRAQEALSLVSHSGLKSIKDGENFVQINIYPNYLEQLKSCRVIDVNDTSTDPRVEEFIETYIKPSNIKSFLDVPIRINGHLEGVINLERTDQQKNWTDSEIYFVSQLADQLALTLATNHTYAQDEQISLFKCAAEQAQQIFMLVNMETQIVEFVNDAYEKITGVAKETFMGKPITELMIFKSRPDVAENMLAALKKGEKVVGEVKVDTPSGKSYWAGYNCSPFITSRGKKYALINNEDITEKRQQQEELERLAWNCTLTNLKNRTYFNSLLERSFNGYLVLIDLKNFKHFNDTYGHEKGDALLIEVARKLKHFAEVKKAKEVARVGSDEFAIILSSEFSMDEIEHLALELYQNLSSKIQIKRQSVEPKPALAIVDIAEVANLVSPLTSADLALQIAKKKVTIPIQCFNHDLLSSFLDKAQIEQDLHVAMNNRQFELYYQPLRDLKTGEYTGAEALIRWNHPKKGVIFPGSFIEIAEQTGFINVLGDWVLEEACRKLNLWHHQKPDLTMNVNVSASQLFSDDLFEKVWNLLNKYQLTPQSLILEITETEIMTDIQMATNLCQQLSELGVGLAIDDFGTGYSSMRYLKQLPISKLKIDRSFISDITDSHESREIVNAIIAMAKALNLSLTAEGIETGEQEGYLIAQHCHQGQGYLYSPAIREADFMKFLEIGEVKAECVM
ncbi:EAL domain-containing protein [Parashewanella curva]|uniref:cyclic-guanylate-specific phosphodiesterase n=1 Tax=Parashewanella curva TaxID=2338552 RepID=A0A3L8PYY4_9GAMM|nr:EAL domain-containing protein [Parashewanella curva]RLV60607.1 EAL domain-containing protein [Parashewanella curva]